MRRRLLVVLWLSLLPVALFADGPAPVPVQVDASLDRADAAIGQTVRLTLELALSPGVEMEPPAADTLEFPGFDRTAPFAVQPLVGVGGHNASASSLGNAIVRFDPVTGATQRFDYGEGIIVEEPLFVPAMGGSYIIHTLLDYGRRRSGLAILKANRLADGPVAIARMDRVLPLGFHGCFCPRVPSNPA